MGGEDEDEEEEVQWVLSDLQRLARALRGQVIGANS
jgi:hypothetical protein